MRRNAVSDDVRGGRSVAFVVSSRPDEGLKMPLRVRLLHKTMLNGRFHVFTSPDINGFHISMETLAGAQREAIIVLDDIARDQGATPPVVDFIFETVSEAA